MNTNRIRASDQEREQVATILRAAMTEGRFTLADGEERIAAAYAATYRDELGPLTADLPDGGRRALVDTPEVQAYARRALSRHVAGFGLIAAVLVGLWALSGAHFFWPLIPLFFLGFGVLRHARWRRYAAMRGWVPGYEWHPSSRRGWQRHSADRW